MQCKLFFRIRSERNPWVAVFILETEISVINLFPGLEDISAFLMFIIFSVEWDSVQNVIPGLQFLFWKLKFLLVLAEQSGMKLNCE